MLLMRPVERGRRPLRIAPPENRRLSALIAENGERFDEIDDAPLDPLLDRIGHAPWC